MIREWFIITCLAMLAQSQPEQKLMSHDVRRESGQLLHIEDIDRSKIFCKHHSLTFNIEIRDIDEVTQKITYYIDSLEKICIESSLATCKLTIKELINLGETLKNKIKLIKRMHQVKRMGRYAPSYKQIIRKTINLADYSYSDLKRSIEEIKLMIETLRKGQNRINHHLENIDFNAIAALASVSIKNYIAKHELIIEVLMYRNARRILELISPESMKFNLLMIQKYAEKEGCELPTNIKDMNEIKLLEISQIRTGMIHRELGITIRIPTVYRNIFTLSKATPLPFDYFQEIAQVTPNSPYALTHYDSEHETIYAIPMSREEKSKCRSVESNINYLLCSPEKPIQVFKSKNKTNHETLKHIFLPSYKWCNYGILTSGGVLYESITCNLVVMPKVNTQIKLPYGKQFIYIAAPTQVHVNCGNQSYAYNTTVSTMFSKIKDCSVTVGSNFYPNSSGLQTTIVQREENPFPTYSLTRKGFANEKLLKEFPFTPIRELQAEFGLTEIELNQLDEQAPKKDDFFKKWKPLIIIIVFMIPAIGIFLFCYELIYRMLAFQEKISKKSKIQTQALIRTHTSPTPI